jgi:hypothetical protein
MISQVMPSCFSIRTVSYFFVVIVVSRFFVKRTPDGDCRRQNGPDDPSAASALRGVADLTLPSASPRVRHPHLQTVLYEETSLKPSGPLSA